MRRFVVLFTVVVNLVLVDAVVKELAAGYLKGAAARPVVANLFDLAYVENRGCAWGMFQGQVWPLAAFGLAALAFLVWQRKSVFGLSRTQPCGTTAWSRLQPCLGAIAEPLLYAGIIGNVIDRLVRGYVIDMFDFHWGVHHFPCFNVADSLITVSVGLLLLSSFLCPSSRKPNR